MTPRTPDDGGTVDPVDAHEHEQPARDALLGRLAGQRRHVLAALDGLAEADLRRPLLPSGWTALGMLRHLTLGGERYWVHTVLGGTPLDWWPTRPDEPGRPADWFVGDEEPAAQVLDDYREAVEESDRVLAGLALTDPPRLPEPWWEEAGMSFPDVHAVLLHLLVETATHAGHLDAARELIDGRRHLVL